MTPVKVLYLFLSGLADSYLRDNNGYKMNKTQYDKFIKQLREGTKNVVVASPVTLMRHALIFIFGLGVMLLLMSLFHPFSSRVNSPEIFTIPAPPPAQETSEQIVSDNNPVDYNMDQQTTVALPEKHPLLEENTLPTKIEAKEHTGVPSTIWHEITLRQGDNLTSVFKRYRLGAATLKQMAMVPHGNAITRTLKPGHTLRLLIDNRNQLRKLMYEINADQTLIITKISNKFKSEIQHKDFREEFSLNSGTIHGNLPQTLRRAHLSYAQWREFTKIFSEILDFRRDIKSGDQFEILYKKYRYNDNSIRSGGIVAARLRTAKHTYTAIYFTDKNGKNGRYYSPEGYSLEKSFLRIPIRFKRISSPFDLSRRHPILKIKRPHEGVDLTADHGTPIQAIGDGYVTYVGRNGGYGKMVEVDHHRGVTTVYAHMSQYAKRLRSGMPVKKGQIIGYVGSTGLATGPHLHYEYRIHGAPKNPLTVKLPSGKKIPGSYRSRFRDHSGQMIAQLDNNNLQYMNLAKKD